MSIRQFAHSLVLKPEGGTYVVVVVANITQRHGFDDHCSSISHIRKLRKKGKRRKQTIFLSGKDDQMLR